MIDERKKIILLINEACGSGARQVKACDIVGISPKTFQRWSCKDNMQDGRLEAKNSPSNKLTELEYQRLIKVANEPDYADLPPNKIVPKLADEGRYIASESTFYRVLKAHNQLHHRQKAKPTGQIKKPKALCATAPNQIYSWDISYLPTQVRGIFFYLYLVMDIFSRKIVGWQVHEEESSAQAADLMTDICAREGVQRHQVTLHSDNGSPMKGATMLATLQQLGVIPSFSRPSVSNDNPYSESLFRTLKYRPEYPENPFADLTDARNWVQGFV
ncbi:MAG: IS3 family transposase, partial [Proteobacteria bacterium]|nr:IS3 family transposase [Pseudomonadota bacterium]